MIVGLVTSMGRLSWLTPVQRPSTAVWPDVSIQLLICEAEYQPSAVEQLAEWPEQKHGRQPSSTQSPSP